MRRSRKGGAFASKERTETRGEEYGKSALPKSSWRESGKLETVAGTKLKKGERRGFKFH